MTLVGERASAALTRSLRSPRVPRGLRGTPGRLALVLAALVTLGAATGVAAAVGVGQRADQAAGVTAHSGRLMLAAQRLYRALSDADATAASAFLAGGSEPRALRERYQSDVAEAAATLAEVSAAGSGAPTVARIAAQLPVYTGLVETARTYNRQGLPLGGAYLREASGLMRGTLLPAARELYALATAELDAARGKAAGFPWFAVLLGLLTIAALVRAQVWLTRRTNRVFNVGLVAATAAALVLVGWLGISAVLAGQRLEASREDGSAQAAVLVEARIAALEARADEALTLAARGGGAPFEQSFIAVMGRLAGPDGNGGLLAAARAQATDDTTRAALAAATERARAWVAAHRTVRAADDGGDYAAAVTAAVGAGPDTTATLSRQLDEELGRAIAATSQRFDREARGAGRLVSGVDGGLAALAVLLVAGAAVGIQRRLAEYR